MNHLGVTFNVSGDYNIHHSYACPCRDKPVGLNRFLRYIVYPEPDA